MINCKKCNKQIISKDDINVTALLGLIPKAFCNDCYSRAERGIKRHMFYVPRWWPINSTVFKIVLGGGTAILILAAIAIFSGQGQWKVGGEEAQASEVSLGAKITLIAIMSILVVWFWALFFIARNMVNKAGRQQNISKI